MNKKILKSLSLATIALGLLFNTVLVSAAPTREVGSFVSFHIPTFQGVVYTGYLLKATTNGAAVLNITSCVSVSKLETGMYNTDNVLRSTYTIMNIPNRNEIATTGTSGYSYREMMMNSNSSVFEASVTGSWSPDSK